MLCLIVLFTHDAPYLVIVIHLPCSSLKQKFMTSFVACFNLSFGMILYWVEKLKVETELALFVLCSLSISLYIKYIIVYIII